MARHAQHMAATITPNTPNPTPANPPTHGVGSAERTGPHRLIILHAEPDSDETLLEFTRRIGPGDHVTLANLRPAMAATLPPGGIMSDLGMMVYLDSRSAQEDYERQLELRIDARSRLLRELGIDHEIITETYHRSVVSRITARSVRKALGRIANHARADEIVVGPGAIVECQRFD